MNDQKLDEPIGDAHGEEIKENEKNCEQDAAGEDEQAYLEPALWWFASTAFPLIAGTFGPMASTFSICALAVHWRAEIPPGLAEKEGIDLPDPKWLIAINAVQLIIALIANLFLLMNMARRVRFSIGMPVTIIGWYISSFTLTALCALARGPLIVQPRSNHAFTQAYYYAIFSAGLYFIVASLLLVTVWGAYKGHYEKEFQLTMSQRTLMLQTISFLTYLLAGAAVFARVEKWRYLDAVYFADYTLLTVGIGNLSPSTHTGRSLLFPFAIGGIIILGLVIGSIRSLVLERGKVKMGHRMVEKERRRAIKRLQKKKKDAVLQPIKDSKSPSPTATVDDGSELLTERERRLQEFKLMRKIQSDAQRKRRWTSLFISAATWMALWFVGAAIFQICEKDQGWSYFVSLYFSYVSLLTIGYGDYYPNSNSGRAFFVFWSLLAIPSLTILISNMGDTIVKGIRDLTLWLGNLTVLPGESEKSTKAALKEAASQITKGKLFKSNLENTPPSGVLGEAKPRVSEDSEDHLPKNDPESARQALDDTFKKIHDKSAHERGKNNDELPESRHHVHLLLIKEIGTVTRHLNSSPPVKYSFEEWSWYLKLVGDDEDDPDRHREPVRSAKELEEEAFGELNGEGNGGLSGEGIGGGGDNEGEERMNGMQREAAKEGTKEVTDGKEVKWSWVGNRSPLMANKEEAEWVLERLTKKLERELEAIRREEMERMGIEDKQTGREEEGSSSRSEGKRVSQDVDG